MTRLIEDWIKDISVTTKQYEKDLESKTGLDFIGLASAVGDVSREKIVLSSKNNKVGVIPITTGLGIIGSFSESVAAILQCMNFEAFITEHTDVAGLHEAYQREAKMIFLADDNRFIAINLEKNIISENNQATARGYVAAMEGAVGKLQDRDVLVIGCGVVGREILRLLILKGAKPIAYDINESVLESLTNDGFKIITHSDEMAKYALVIDASSKGGWIHKGMLHPEAWIVTPGVPLSLDSDAYDYHKDRVIHDYLQIGVVAMLAEIC